MMCPGEGMKPEGYENCWEYWECTSGAKARCPVYNSGKGDRCWLYMDNLTVFDWAKPRRKYNRCTDCPWYKIVNEREIEQKGA